MLYCAQPADSIIPGRFADQTDGTDGIDGIDQIDGTDGIDGTDQPAEMMVSNVES